MHKFSRCFALSMTCVFLLFLLVGTTSAQLKGKISGQILEQGTDEPLAGANILIDGTQLGAAADADGFYFCKLKKSSAEKC